MAVRTRGGTKCLYERSGSFDVHRRVIAACLIDPEGHGPNNELRTYGIMGQLGPGPVGAARLLEAVGCTQLGMENTL